MSLRKVIRMPTLFSLTKKLTLDYEGPMLALPIITTINNYYSLNCQKTKNTYNCISQGYCKCGHKIDLFPNDFSTTMDYSDPESAFRLAKLSRCNKVLLPGDELSNYSHIGLYNKNQGWLIDIRKNTVERVKMENLR